MMGGIVPRRTSTLAITGVEVLGLYYELETLKVFEYDGHLVAATFLVAVFTLGLSTPVEGHELVWYRATTPRPYVGYREQVQRCWTEARPSHSGAVIASDLYVETEVLVAVVDPRGGCFRGVEF